MKRKFTLLFASLLGCGFAQADGLYYIGSEAQESMPLRWVVGTNVTYDDNVTPTAVGAKDSAVSVNPYVGLSFVSVTPQTTWDVYARLGLIYYFDQPSAAGADDLYGQARVGANLTHRFSERLRLSSRNFLAYELEPDYSYGYASTRQVGEYFFWQTDNSLGFRWSERFATYTGFQLTGLDYSDVANSDRFTWTLYNQVRYQLSPQTVLTAEYRYGQTEAEGLASDSTDQHILLGVEHRFSPTTILVARAGAQIRDVDSGSDSTNPYLELALHSRINEQFRVRSFVRYSTEVYDTVRPVGAGLYDFSERQTLRVGISGEYALSPMFSIFGGVDYIPSDFDSGIRRTGAGPATVSGIEEDIISAYVGLSVKFTDYLYGTLSYTFTDSDSDFVGASYDRNRVNVGIRAEF